MREIPTFDPRRAGADPAPVWLVPPCDSAASTRVELAPGGRFSRRG